VTRQSRLTYHRAPAVQHRRGTGALPYVARKPKKPPDPPPGPRLPSFFTRA
jgi:hypothetical protein